MLNYYDEMKNDIMEALKYDYAEILESTENKEDAYYQLEEIFFIKDSITGNASGSYYFNSYESRKHCYEYFRDVFEALEEYGYKKELQRFKTFVGLVEEGYLNIENMTLNYDILNEADDDERCYAFYALEEMEGLDFEALDVITRCYLLGSVLWDVLDKKTTLTSR